MDCGFDDTAFHKVTGPLTWTIKDKVYKFCHRLEHCQITVSRNSSQLSKIRSISFVMDWSIVKSTVSRNSSQLPMTWNKITNSATHLSWLGFFMKWINVTKQQIKNPSQFFRSLYEMEYHPNHNLSKLVKFVRSFYEMEYHSNHNLSKLVKFVRSLYEMDYHPNHSPLKLVRSLHAMD